MRAVSLLFICLIFGPAIKAQSKAVEDVKKVLSSYKQKLEKLDTSGVTSFFASGALVYEAGKDEGGIQNYLNHHLGPELKAFKSFTFSDYIVDVRLNGDYAYTMETYLLCLPKTAAKLRVEV